MQLVPSRSNRDHEGVQRLSWQLNRCHALRCNLRQAPFVPYKGCLSPNVGSRRWPRYLRLLLILSLCLINAWKIYHHLYSQLLLLWESKSSMSLAIYVEGVALPRSGSILSYRSCWPVWANLEDNLLKPRHQGVAFQHADWKIHED